MFVQLLPAVQYAHDPADDEVHHEIGARVDVFGFSCQHCQQSFALVVMERLIEHRIGVRPDDHGQTLGAFAFLFGGDELAHVLAPMLQIRHMAVAAALHQWGAVDLVMNGAVGKLVEFVEMIVERIAIHVRSSNDVGDGDVSVSAFAQQMPEGVDHTLYGRWRVTIKTGTGHRCSF